MSNWECLDNTYIMKTTSRLPIVVDKAEGNYIYDLNGKKYLDLFTGLGVSILGHRHPYLVQLLKQQTEKYLHISNFFYDPSSIRLAERLVTHSLGKGNIFYCNSGAEATETMLKLIDKWSRKQETKKEGIVVLKNSFHGRTLGVLHLTRQPIVYQDFPELDLPIYEVNPNDVDELTQICTQYNPAAILFEPILGSGGIVSLTQEYVHTIATICHEKNILLCVDEIQTGIGRTGRLFAFEEFGIQPDLLLFAKAIGGGLPLGGVIAGTKTSELFRPGDHGSTFAPSPLSIAMANGVLDLLLDGGLEQSQRSAEELWKKLDRLKILFPSIIAAIDGKGMMVGIRTHLTQEQITNLQFQLMEEGILINITASTVIRLLPPLTLTVEEIEFFFHILEKYLRKIA